MSTTIRMCASTHHRTIKTRPSLRRLSPTFHARILVTRALLPLVAVFQRPQLVQPLQRLAFQKMSLCPRLQKSSECISQRLHRFPSKGNLSHRHTQRCLPVLCPHLQYCLLPPCHPQQSYLVSVLLYLLRFGNELMISCCIYSSDR